MNARENEILNHFFVSETFLSNEVSERFVHGLLELFWSLDFKWFLGGELLLFVIILGLKMKSFIQISFQFYFKFLLV